MRGISGSLSDSDLSMESKYPSNAQYRDFNFTATRNLEIDDGVPQLKKSSSNNLSTQRSFRKSAHLESKLRRCKPPRRNLTQRNSKPITVITTHTKFTAKLVNPVIGFVLAPYTHGVKPLLRFRHRKRKQGNNEDLNSRNHNIINSEDDTTLSDNAAENMSDFGNAIASKKTGTISKTIKKFKTGRHTQENNKEEKILFRTPILTKSSSEKKRHNQTGGVNLGEKIHIRQKLCSLFHGPGLSYRILRWVCIITLVTNPLALISGILPIMLLWMVFGDIIRFILHQGRKKLAEGCLPKKIVQIVRKAVRETQESQRARKKYFYAAGVANKFVFKQN